jgi:large subunit ribosomal protein L4
MEITLLKDNINKIYLSDKIFKKEYNENLVHQFINSFISNSHIGTKSHKSRSDVSGGGKKPWRQKGSGRARAGSTRSPLWRSGGKTFVSDYINNNKKKINRKVYKIGMSIIFSELFRNNRISIINDFNIDKISTKLFLKNFDYLNLNKTNLFIVDKIDNNIYFSSRNVKRIKIIDCLKINPLILLKFNNIFITEKAIKIIEEKLNV